MRNLKLVKFIMSKYITSSILIYLIKKVLFYILYKIFKIKINNFLIINCFILLLLNKK